MRDKWVLYAEDVPKNYITFDLSPGPLLYSLLVLLLRSSSISCYQEPVSEYQGYGLKGLESSSVWCVFVYVRFVRKYQN